MSLQALIEEDPRIGIQIQQEEQAATDGINEYRKRVQKMREQNLESTTSYGKCIVSRSIEPMEKAIGKFKEAAKSKPGRKHSALKLLAAIPNDVAAFITCKGVCDGISDEEPFSTVALMIAGRLEDEARFSLLAQHETTDKEGKVYTGAVFKAVEKNLKENPMGYQERVRRANMVNASKKAGISWAAWSRADKVLLGSKLLELFIQHVGLVETYKVRRGKRKNVTVIGPTEAYVEWVTKYNEMAEVAKPFLLPMLCPPKDWTTPFDGGFYTEKIRLTLVKSNQKYLTELGKREPTTVYQAINSLQRTPWKINAALLSLLQEVWETGIETDSLPSRQAIPRPPEPDYEHDPKGWAEWKRRSADIYRKNLSNASNLTQTVRIKTLAERYLNSEAIWFPYQLDFRGRLYAVPPYLNPQGCDLAKALLTFAEGKPLGERGVFWLGVHIANCFGYDKVSLEERYQWTQEHSERIERMANDPLGDPWWTEADKPWQFLAACVEWLGYLTDGGENYVCSLPILVDGSCNGIQNFAAMLRDEVSGAGVNLVPLDKPADIYAEVASVVRRKLEANKENPYASQWLALGIDRKTTKRPVMVLPYGGTRQAIRTYLIEWAKGEPHPFGKELGKAGSYLADVTSAAMDEVIVGPRVAMDKLRAWAGLLAKKNLAIDWTTPSGFWVRQAYPNLSKRLVKTHIGHQMIRFVMREPSEKKDNKKRLKLDSRRQVQACPPNFVHSLDASALALTVVRCVDRGIISFAAIHDSYGTVAADMDTLQMTLRRVFVEMYENHDVLTEFRERVIEILEENGEDFSKVPTVPEKGNLDLRKVLESRYFFA